MWNDMFVIALPLLEKIIRPILVYLALVVLLRIFGKRELAQLNPFDLVVLLTLSNTVQNAIIGNDNSVSGGLIGALTLLAVNYLVVRFLFQHRRLDEIVEGKAIKLIDRGKVLQKNLASELLTHTELLTVLHRQGFSGLDEVEQCVLEPGGTFAIKRKEPPQSDIQYAELIRRLEGIDARLAALTPAKGGKG
ncbi:MAG TPA: YetF domain-containing protein [Bryobacteraceae bacterium]|nr:YetF domain-containing protein [Bryobacteraceae bacterium]